MRKDAASWQSYCDTWRSQQPKAVQTLTHNFEDTLTFFAIQEYTAQFGEVWPARLLRTASPLERMLCEFRRRYRQAILFHSPVGLFAAAT